MPKKNQDNNKNTEKTVGTMENPNYNSSYIPDAYGLTTEEYAKAVGKSITDMYAILEGQKEDLTASKNLVELIKTSDDINAVGCINLLLGHVNELYDMKLALTTLVSKVVKPMLKSELMAINEHMSYITQAVSELMAKNAEPKSGIIVP